MTVSMGFFSFRQQDGSPKLMVPPKGMTKWKTKCFYIKVAAVAANLTFRNVTGTIITEGISAPKADTVDLFPRLRIIGWKKLSNSQLLVLRMMLGRMSRKARPVLREKSEDAPLWRMFCLDFKGKVVVLPCGGGEEGFNFTIHDNFRLPEREAMEAALPQGKGDLGALGDPDATSVPKQHMEKHGDKRLPRPKKLHEPVVVPPLVPEVAGISRIRLRKYNDYVVVSNTLEGLGVQGGGAAAGGSYAGFKPVVDKKRKGDASATGGQKGPKLRRTRMAAIPQPKPAVTTETRAKPVFEFATTSSPPKAADVEVQKEGRRSPSIEVSPVPEKPKSPVAEKASGSTATGTGVEDQPTIQPGGTELEFYYRSYAVDRGLDYHSPPWTVMEGDDISNNPSACREILGVWVHLMKFFGPAHCLVGTG
ncbi:hypothetical protein Hanom_Chr09g00784291 [Helianthus anomalus]